jgi:hypothetical protein
MKKKPKRKKPKRMSLGETEILMQIMRNNIARVERENDQIRRGQR